MQKESPTLERIRIRLRAELENREMTIKELADGAGLSRPWLSNFLSGKVALSFADADVIAEFLDLPLADIISEKIHA